MYPSSAPVPDPTAVIGRRFGAWIIDTAIAGVLFFALFLGMAEQREFTTNAGAERFCDELNAGDTYICGASEGSTFFITYDDAALMGAIVLGFWFVNDALLTGITGFSIGKGLVGLRVVRQSDGRRAGFGRAVGRWALWVVDWAPWCVPLVGLITANASKGHRRVGDMVCKTLVVDRHQVGYAPQVPGLTAPEMGYGAAAPWGAPGTPPWGAPPAPGGWGAPPAPGGWAPPPAPAPGGWNPPPAPGGGWNTPPSAAPPAAPGWNAPSPPQWGAPPSPAPPQAGGWEQPAPSWAPPAPTSPGPAPVPQWSAPDPTTVQPVIGPDASPTQQHPIFEPAAPPAPAASTPGVDGPLWDDARDTYIQWDPEISRWVQWDEAAGRWDPI